MGDQRILKWYSRKDVQQQIVALSTNREVAVKFGDKGYGKRPDVLQFESDVKELAQQGATSFHLSEEQWHDPLKLKTGMTRKQLDELRLGWDLILDIDCKFIEFSKIAAELLMEAMQFHNIHTLGLKFSGNRGFHIAVPFSSFPPVVNGKHIPLLFPEGPRMIAEYLSSLMKEHLSSRILSISTPKEISEATGIAMEKLIVKKEFDPFAVIEIDTILISSRHLFRSPYSINEKSGLISVVLSPEKIKNFKPSSAKIENIEEVYPFLSPSQPSNEAAQLLIQAFDYAKKNPTLIQKEEEKKENWLQNERTKITIKIPEDLFPPCVKLLLNGISTDGRKRAILVLINFFKQMNYTLDEIETTLLEWNKKNYEPLREGYIRSQISWHKRNQQSVLPPNCANDAYYVPMGVCKPDGYCSKIKNPTNYSLLRMKMQQEQKKPKKKSSQQNKETMPAKVPSA
jgi:hypothetical protein